MKGVIADNKADHGVANSKMGKGNTKARQAKESAGMAKEKVDTTHNGLSADDNDFDVDKVSAAGRVDAVKAPRPVTRRRATLTHGHQRGRGAERRDRCSGSTWLIQ